MIHWTPEEFYVGAIPDGPLPVEFPVGLDDSTIWYRADFSCESCPRARWRLAENMPRWACRAAVAARKAITERFYGRVLRRRPVSLAFAEATILIEISDKKTKRKSIAKTYRLAMESCEAVSWSRINTAIMTRWSESGLNWIKQQAHSGRAFQ